MGSTSNSKTRASVSPGDGESPDGKKPRRTINLAEWGPGYFVKLVLMALVNAFGVYLLIASFNAKSWGLFAAVLVLVALADWVYFARKTLPLKYILPGLAFLLAFQIYTIFFTVYVSFTNYGDGHNSTKGAAISALLQQNEKRVEGSAAYAVTVVEKGSDLGLAIVTDDGVLAGTAEHPLEQQPDAVVEGNRVTELPGWQVLTTQEMSRQQQAIFDLRVPYTDDPEDGSIRTTDAFNAFVFRPILEYDEAADTMTNVETGVVYHASDRGQFVDDQGNALTVGWRVGVGFENYTKAFGDSRYAGPFYSILWWTFAQAFLSVAFTFLLGLFLAVTFNRKIRGQKIYRVMMILPYAIPAFISALIFAGMFNRSYGFINQVLLGGADIPWLQNAWLAKLAVLLVNLWLGFPYMFLVTTGALQSVPSELEEAAKIDGAGPARQWWSIKFPLVFIATAPLLISSFAFNFNNFSLIYMLTGGGPSFGDPLIPLGHTDILITMVYKISGIDGGAAKDYGLASALSILIFVIVGTISAISFRQTRKLEEIM